MHDPTTNRVFLGCDTMNASCLEFTADQVYRGLVGNRAGGQLVMSIEMPTMPLVTPGEPDHSYLVSKLESGHFEPTSFVATVRAWVQEGAPNN